MKAWILALRPKTLTAAIAPIVVASALAQLYAETLNITVDWSLSWYALFASFFIQIATNLINDAKDFETGADNEERIGPKRVTQSGLLSPKQVFIAAGICMLLSILLGIPLVKAGGIPVMVIGVFSLLSAYAYTAGPYPLAYHGLGELFVILFFGLVAVGGLTYSLVGVFGLNEIVAGLQVGLLCTVLIAINNLRDIIGDKKVNKKTLAVRFGLKFARYEILLLFLIIYMLGAYWWYMGLYYLGLFPLCLLPISLALTFKIFKESPSPKFNQFLAKSSFIHLMFSLLFYLGSMYEAVL